VLAAAWFVVLPALLFGTLSVLAPLRLSVLGLGAIGIGAVFLCSAALEAVNNLWIGQISDRFGPLRPIAVALVASIAVAALLPWPRERFLLAILVVIGYFHKGDIEGVLAGTPGIELVQPSVFGQPTAEEIEAEVLPTDLLAILSFNLLGVQAKDGPVNWEWMERSLRRLEADAVTAETLLLHTRLAVLRSEVNATEAIRLYEQVRAMPAAAIPFTYDGVADRSRVDSYYDPFGNLSVANRALLEIARECRTLGQTDATQQILAELSAAGGLRELQRHQLAAYWDEFVVQMR